MRIDEIDIRNFRGFEDKTFRFHPHINVVVGNNTSGKTALLHAVQIALGAYLRHLDLLSVANGQYRRNFSRTDLPTRYDYDKKQFIPINGTPSIHTRGIFTENIENIDGTSPIQKETAIEWTRELNYNTSDHGEMKEMVKELARVRRIEGTNGYAIMPLFLSFGTKRLEEKKRSKPKNKGIEIAIEKAYKDALNEEVDLKSAFDWLFRLPNDIKKGLAFQDSEQVFIDTLKTAIPAVKDIIINRVTNQFEAQYQVTGLPLDYRTYETMSDGFKSTISIVAAIAYRCILLNGFLGVEAIRKTPGVVTIDEVDLFLHPRWQRHILQDFQRAFPNIQFIVTTHSPFIIQSVRNENLTVLEGFDKTIDPDNMGLEEIADTLMGMTGELRSKKYNEKFSLATDYLTLVNEGNGDPSKIAEIRARLEELEVREEMIEDPAFAAYLRFKRGNV